MSSTDHLSELESLRSQVADLARALAERDQSMQDLREQSQLLRTIVEGTAAETGDEFFSSLVTHLTSTLHVQYAVIGEVLEGRLRKIRTLAVSSGGTLVDDFEYELAHTPCATALTQTFACFGRDVQATFPQFQRLADLGAESYCAVPLRTKGGTVIGLLILMDTKPLQQGDYLQSLLGVFAPHVAAEFERRRAEQERAQALADIHNVLETVPDIMFTLDTQGNMVRWNRRVEEVTGYSPEELLDKPALAFVPPEEQTRTSAAIQRAFMEGYAELEGLLLTKDHRTIPYHWTGAALKDPDGRIIGITGIGRDVSEKKRAETKMQEQRRHLVAAQALAHLGSWDWDIDTGEVQWSDEQYRIFGHEPEALPVTYDTFLTSLHPDDNDRVLAAINDALAGKRSHDVECRIVRPNGELRIIHSRGDVHRDTTGHPLSMAGTVLDITDRKQTEEALRISEERWQLAARGSKDGIWDWNIQAGEVYFSARWKAMRGYEESELANTISEWQSRIHPDDLERVLQRIDQYLAKQRPEYYEEYRVERKDGSYMWVLDRGMALWADDGTPLRMAGSETDITERKQAEKALAQSERQLRTVLDALPVGVWFTDRLGKPLLANPVAMQIWSNIKRVGLQNPDNSIGWWETIEPTSEPHRWALSHVLVTGVPSLNEILNFECLDGTKKVIRNSTVPVQSEAGVTLGAIVLNEDITMLRQAQAALQLTQFSVDHAVEGFFWIGPDARIFHVNDSACRMLEYTWEELTTMTLHDIDPNLSSEVWPAHWEELKEKGSLTFESKYWSRTGRVLDTEVTVNYLQYEGKEYNCTIMRDIAERKQADAALRASEERYRELYDNTPTMYFTLATDGTVLSVNRFGSEQLGYSVEELVGRSVMHVFYEEDKDAVVTRLSECLATPEETSRWEFRKVRKDGQVIWVRETVRVGQSSTGETVVLVTGEDITERKRAEEELQKSHAFIRQVIDTDPNFIFAKDRDGRFTLVNKAVADAYGTTVDDLVGKTDADFNPNQEEVEFFRQKDLEVMNSLQDLFLPEEVITDSTGRTRWLQTVKRPMLDEQGQAIMVLGAATDITERKRIEEVLRQRERDLRTALDERERISQDLHDGILQSLFAVGLTLETTKLTMSPRTRKTSSPPLDQAIKQLNLVMHEIRNFIAGLGSDLLQGKDLPTALQQMLASLTENQATRVRLAVEDRAAKAVSAEQSLHLFLVIQEAVSNCIQHGRAQEARVSLKMLKQGVRLSIRDNGRGFNQDIAKGTGHGLGNMAARAQKIGGRFTVLSKVNEGTSIVLDLPARPGARG